MKKHKVLIYYCELNGAYNWCRFNVPNEGKYRRQIVAEFEGTWTEIEQEVDKWDSSIKSQ